MNERIQEIALQAGLPKYITREIGPTVIQKFAELLVRECATIAYQWQDEYGIIDDYYTPPPIDDVIKQQFGVLE